MGARCELLAVGRSDELLAAGEAKVRAADARFTRFDPTSELSRFNRAAGEWTPVSAALQGMLQACLDAYQRSDGLVNAAVLPALVAAGYSERFAAGQPASNRAACGPLPALAEVLEIDRRGRRARLHPQCAVDLGGIAKGALADELSGELGDNALCNLGGDLRARGNALGEGWLVGLPDGQTVALTDGAIATSGTWKRTWGPGLHHVIDPRTGAPAVTDLRWVTVAAVDGLSAEIFAKTALILGAVKGRQWLKARGIFHVTQPSG